MYNGIDDKEFEATIKAIRAYGKEVCKTKESALQSLIRAGICNEKGELNEWYK